MINELQATEKNLLQLLRTKDLHSMYIDYHAPFVKRIWFQLGTNRVFLHKIEPCLDDATALFHPHPWASAVRLIKGSYEMGIGHSADLIPPPVDCQLQLGPNALYSMMNPDGWHYVLPKHEFCYSLMLTGAPNGRQMPLSDVDKKASRSLDGSECRQIIREFNTYYGWGLSDGEVYDVAARVKK